jgi:hypothetical protein
MDQTVCICILFTIILIYQYHNAIESFITTKRSCNKIDGRCYKVSTKYDADTHENASELLAKLNQFSIKLIRHLRDTYLWSSAGSSYKNSMVKFLLHNYDPGSIIENVPKGSVNTSYVENKGVVFALCLREKISGKNKFIPIHSLEYVVLHEMAHMASKTIGHNHEFWVNFKILLQEANNIGLHFPINYEKYPIVYCSLRVNYNPFFDHSIPGKI